MASAARDWTGRPWISCATRRGSENWTWSCYSLRTASPATVGPPDGPHRGVGEMRLSGRVRREADELRAQRPAVVADKGSGSGVWEDAGQRENAPRKVGQAESGVVAALDTLSLWLPNRPRQAPRSRWGEARRGEGGCGGGDLRHVSRGGRDPLWGSQQAPGTGASALREAGRSGRSPPCEGSSPTPYTRAKSTPGEQPPVRHGYDARPRAPSAVPKARRCRWPRRSGSL